MESFNERLKRFINNSENEIPLTLLNSIANFFLPELSVAKERKLDRLIFLGTHAIIQTIGDKIFGRSGRDATKFYLENFVDGSSADRKFSSISDDIHKLRNIMAHQWMSSQSHDITFNYDITEGWKREPNLLHINPDVYAEQFIKGFSLGSSIWRYKKLVSATELVIRKYQFIVDWLGLDQRDTIALEVEKLQSFTAIQDLRNQEAIIKQLIISKYGLN